MMHSTLPNIGTVPVTTSIAFASALTLLGVSGHTLIEQIVLADSCSLRVLDLGGNKLVISGEIAFSATFKACPRRA
jgi:hypothetical protein